MFYFLYNVCTFLIELTNFIICNGIEVENSRQQRSKWSELNYHPNFILYSIRIRFLEISKIDVLYLGLGLDGFINLAFEWNLVIG